MGTRAKRKRNRLPGVTLSLMLAGLSLTAIGWTQQAAGQGTASEKVAPQPRPRIDAPAAPVEAPSSPPALASATHAGTGLIIPATLAGNRLTRSVDYAQPPANDRRLGMSYHYAGPGPISLSIYVYDGGLRPPDGAANQMVKGQFERARAEIDSVARQTKRYADLRVVGDPEICGPGRVQFQCVAYTALANDQPIYTAVMLGGWRGHFVKLRLDWPNRADVPNAAVAVLAAFAQAQEGGGGGR